MDWVCPPFDEKVEIPSRNRAASGSACTVKPRSMPSIVIICPGKVQLRQPPSLWRVKFVDPGR